MNKIKMCIAVLFCVLISSGSAPEQNLTVYLNEYTPYFSTHDRDNFGEKIFNRIFNNIGYNVKYDYKTYVESVNNAISNKNSVLLVSGWQPYMETIFLRSNPIFKDTFILIKRKNVDIKYSGYESLRGLNVGVVQGEVFNLGFESVKEELNVKEYIDATVAAVNLYGADIDVLIVSKLTWEHIRTHTMSTLNRYFDEMGVIGYSYEYALFNKDISNVQFLIKHFNSEFSNISKELGYNVHDPDSLLDVYNSIIYNKGK